MLAARQNIMLSSTWPRQQARNASTIAAPSQYGRAWNDGDWYRLVNAARRALIQRISGVVKPTFQRRRRIFSGNVPFIAARRIQRLQPSRMMASSGRLRMWSTSSWSRYGTRLSMLKAMELRSSYRRRQGRLYVSRSWRSRCLRSSCERPYPGSLTLALNDGRSRRRTGSRLRRWPMRRFASGQSTSRESSASSRSLPYSASRRSWRR